MLTRRGLILGLLGVVGAAAGGPAASARKVYRGIDLSTADDSVVMGELLPNGQLRVWLPGPDGLRRCEILGEPRGRGRLR